MARPELIRQGDVFWLNMDQPSGSEPGYRRPFVVVQNSLANGSRLGTTLACALSSNVRLAAWPGNVLLPAGEANLPLDSVVVVSSLTAFDKAAFEEWIGRVSLLAIREIVRGVVQLIEPPA